MASGHESIKDLVNSIKKHSNFKRLAAYSIQSLCKKCTPPSNGWQGSAVDAFEAGACDAIAEVLAKNSKDSEIFLQSLMQLQATAAVGMASGLVTTGVASIVIKSFLEYASAAELPTADAAVKSGLIVNGMYSPSGPDAEAVAVTESFLRFITYISLNARSEAATSNAGVIDCLLTLLPRLPTPNAVRLAFLALDSLSRSEAGLQQLASPRYIVAVLAGAASLFGVGEAGGIGHIRSPTGRANRVAAASASGARRPMSMGGGLSVLGSGSSGSLARLNGHLDPAFRVLDRISRNEEGLRSLRDSKAVSQMAASVEFAQSGVDNPTVGQMGVRVLARVLGNDLQSLIDKISGVSKGDVSVGEGEFAASLLASLALDADVAGRLVSAGLTSPMLQLLEVNGGKAVCGKVAASLCQAIRRIASHSSDYLDSILDSNAIVRLMTTARASAADPRVVSESLSCLAELICDPAHVTAADAVPAPPGSTAGGSGSGVDFVLDQLKDIGEIEAPVACASLQFLHACQCFGYDLDALVAKGIIQHALAAMNSTVSNAKEYADLQVYGTLVLTAAATSPANVDAIVKAGGIQLAILNLQMRHGMVAGAASTGAAGAAASGGSNAHGRMLSYSAQLVGRDSLAYAGARNSVSLGRVSGRRSVDDDGPARSNDQSAPTTGGASNELLAILVAVTLHLLTVLCDNDEHTRDAKSRGLIRSMLSAYTYHSANDAVHDVFVDLVEQITKDNEISSAIQSVLKGINYLKETCGDPALFSIAEADLGREGATGDDGSILAASGVEDGGDSAATASPSGTTKSPATKKAPRGAMAKEPPNTVALRMTEDLCLLEAVTNSARLSNVLVKFQGVPVLVRTIALMAVVKARQDVTDPRRIGNKGTAVVLQQAGGAAAEVEKAVSESLQEEVLMRSCDTITGLARINLDSRFGVPGLDPVPTSISNGTSLVSSGVGGRGASSASRPGAGMRLSSPITSNATKLAARAGVVSSGHRRMRSGKTTGDAFFRIQADIGSAVYRPVVFRILVKAINTRSNLRSLVSAASVALGVLSLGSLGASCSPLEVIIGQGGVESVVGGMRTHPNAQHVLLSVTNGLGCIAISGRPIDEQTGALRMPAPAETAGSAAVATRGATRQIIRELQNAAAAANGGGSRWNGILGQAALCSMLRVLLVVAETGKGADLLKKQGCVDTLIATLDSSASSASDGAAGGDGASSGSGTTTGKDHEGGPSKGEDDKGSAVANALAGGDAFGGLLPSLTPSGSDGRSGAAGAGSGAEIVGDAFGSVNGEANQLVIAILSKLMDTKDLAEALKMILSTTEKINHGTVKPGNTTLCSVALTTVLALANTENGQKAGASIWSESIEAVVGLITAINAAAGTAINTKTSPVQLQMASVAAAALMPSATRCLDAISCFRSSFDGMDGEVSKRWSTSASTGASALVRVLELAKGCGAADGSKPNAAGEKISSSYAGSINDALEGLLTLARRDDGVVKALLANGSTNGTAGPISGLLRVTSRFTDDGEVEALSTAVELLVALSRGPAPPGIKQDGLALLLAAVPEVGPVADKAARELLSASAHARAVGNALVLLGRLCNRDPKLAATVRASGGLELVKQSLGRYCSIDTEAVDGLDHDASGASKVMEGSALLASSLAGRVSAGEDAEGAMQADRAILTKIVSTVRDDPSKSYVNASRTMVSVCDLISACCTEANDAAAGCAITAETVEANRTLVTGMDGRTMIVTAMSAPSADARMLKAGARALQALGGGSAAGVASDVRRSLAALRRACMLPEVPGLLPELSGPVLESGDAASVNGASNAAAGAATPLSPSSSIRSSKDKSPTEALGELDTSLRNLAATLASEHSMTAAAHRFVFDTIAHAVSAADASRQVVGNGSVPLAESALSPSGVASDVAGIMSGIPASRAPSRSMRGVQHSHSVSIQSRASFMHGHSSSGQLQPVAEATGEASGDQQPASASSASRTSPSKSQPASGSAVTDPAVQSFIAHCNAVAASGVQGAVRLINIAIVPNSAAGSMPDGAAAATSAAATAALMAALGPLEATRVYDATGDEKFRYGDPRGTASQALVARLHGDLSSVMGAAGTPTGAPTQHSHPVVPPVTAGDLIDVMVRAIGTGSVMSGDAADSVSRALADLVQTAAVRPLFRVEAASSASTATTPGEQPPSSTSTESPQSIAASKSELVWAFASRGLAHLATVALLAAADDGKYDISRRLSQTATTTGPSPAAVGAAAVVAPRLRDGIQAVMSIAGETDVLRFLALAIADAQQASAGSPKQQTIPSPINSVTARAGITSLPAPIGITSINGSLWRGLPLSAGPITATPATVMLQLMQTAEAMTRPGANDLVRITNEFEASANTEDAGDNYDGAHQLLLQLSSRDDLRSLIKGVIQPDGFAFPASPVWILLTQVMDQGTSGGMLRLSAVSTDDAARSPASALASPRRVAVPATSIAYMRILAEMLESLHSASAVAASVPGSTSASTTRAVLLDKDSNGRIPHIPATLASVATLYSAWAKAGAAVLDHDDDDPAPFIGIEAQSEHEDDGHGAGTAGEAVATDENGAPLSVQSSEAARKAAARGLHLSIESSNVVSGFTGVQQQINAAAARPAVASMDANAAADAAQRSQEATAAMNLYRCMGKAVVAASVRVLGHVDMDGNGSGKNGSSPASNPQSTGGSPTGDAQLSSPSGGMVTTVDMLLKDPSSMSMARCILRQKGADVLATAGIQVLRRIIGFTSTTSPTSSSPYNESRVQCLTESGVLLRVILALGLHSSSKLYAREAMRLLHDLGLSVAKTRSEQKYSGAMLVELGLNEDCLRTLQTTTKRLGRERDGGDDAIRATGDILVAALSEVYASMSAQGFLDALDRCCDAAEECSFVRRSLKGEWVFIPREGSSKTSGASSGSRDGDGMSSPSAAKALRDMPEPYSLLDRAVEDLTAVCDGIEADAVPPVPMVMLKRVSECIKSYRQDARVVTALVWGLQRSCDNGANQPEIMKTSAVEAVVALVRHHRTDADVAEAISAFLRPLTVRLPFVQILKTKGAVPALCELLDAHVDKMLPPRKRGSAANGSSSGGDANSAAAKAERAKAEREVMRKLKSPSNNGSGAATGAADDGEGPLDSTSSSGSAGAANKSPIVLEPRIAHHIVQCLANIACDQTIDEPSSIPNFNEYKQQLTGDCCGGVARVVCAEGVPALIKVMDAHLERPRILEDALCAVSNLAYACDGVRLLIGRTASPLIVNVLRVFNSDPYLFSMALRAVGNLTRCDENIISTVAAGVIEGIVDGMKKNKENAEVLTLAADVVGNLASIDEEAIDKKEGLRALRGGQRRREKEKGAASTGGDMVKSPIKDSKEDGSASSRSNRMQAMLARAKQAKEQDEMSLQDAVSRWLLDDGAHAGLVDAMLGHSTDAGVVSACLRSLQYMAETRELVERMQATVNLAREVCLVMRSCDFDPELCIRGSLLLVQMLRNEGSPARSAALDAGSSHVLLSCIETHRLNVEVFTTVLRAVNNTISSETSTLSAARELSTPKTVIGIMDTVGKILVKSGGIPAILQARTRDGGKKAGAGKSSKGADADAMQESKADGDDTSTMHHAVVNTIATCEPETCVSILRMAMETLKPWSSDADLASSTAVPVSNVLIEVLKPGVGSSFTDSSFAETCFTFLSSFAATSPSAASGMADSGIMTIIKPIALSPAHMDRQALVNAVMDIMTAMASASPTTALLGLEGNAHGVCQGVAVHWALKRNAEEPVRRQMYERAGLTLRAVTDAAAPLRVDRAVTEHRAKAEAVADEARAAAAAAAGRKLSVADGIDGMTKVQMRARRAESSSLTPKSKAVDDKQKAKAQKAREKQAVKLASAFNKRDLGAAAWGGTGPAPAAGAGTPAPTAYQASDILEMRAGLMPWTLFPRSTIEDLAGVHDVTVDVWFLPDMHDKAKIKVRKMLLAMSPDLKQLSWSYTSKRHNRVLDWKVNLGKVTNVRVGLPTGKQRRKLFSFRSANNTRSIVLEDDTHTLFHAEMPNGEKQDNLLRTLAVLCQYARAREGAMEPMPDLPPAELASALAASAAGAGAPAPAASAPPAAPGINLLPMAAMPANSTAPPAPGGDAAAAAVSSGWAPAVVPPGATLAMTADGAEPILKMNGDAAAPAADGATAVSNAASTGAAAAEWGSKASNSPRTKAAAVQPARSPSASATATAAPVSATTGA